MGLGRGRSVPAGVGITSQRMLCMVYAVFFTRGKTTPMFLVSPIVVVFFINKYIRTCFVDEGGRTLHGLRSRRLADSLPAIWMHRFAEKNKESYMRFTEIIIGMRNSFQRVWRRMCAWGPTKPKTKNLGVVLPRISLCGL